MHIHINIYVHVIYVCIYAFTHIIITFFFSKWIVLYKVPLYIRHSALAYTINKCTPALWLRFTGSSLEKGVKSVKLRASFPDASSWKAPVFQGHKPGPAVWFAKSSTHRAPHLVQHSFVQLLRANQAHG